MVTYYEVVLLIDDPPLGADISTDKDMVFTNFEDALRYALSLDSSISVAHDVLINYHRSIKISNIK